MRTRPMESVVHQLEIALGSREVLARKLGQPLALFGLHAPAVLRLLYRLAFDLELSVASRHLASAAALYVAEPVDFFPDSDWEDQERMLDNLYAGFAAVDVIIQREGVGPVARHWRSSEAWMSVLGALENLDALRARLPPLVLQKVDAFLLGEPRPGAPTAQDPVRALQSA